MIDCSKVVAEHSIDNSAVKDGSSRLLEADHVTDMLRVHGLSGKELLAVKARNGKGPTVAILKQHIRDRHGTPTCLQSLFLNGGVLHDQIALNLSAGTEVDLQLVVQPTGTRSKLQVELWNACQESNFEIAWVLLEAGVQKDERDEGGRTPLMYAAEAGSLEIVRLLLKAGADTDLTDLFDDTALICAARRGHVEVAQLLLEAGADKDWCNQHRYTALIYAAEKGHSQIVQALLSGLAPVPART